MSDKWKKKPTGLTGGGVCPPSPPYLATLPLNPIVNILLWKSHWNINFEPTWLLILRHWTEDV